MELSSVRQPLFHIGEERYQMLELNGRLESYLSRVKLLEEENQLLREEIHTLRRSRDGGQQRKAQEQALVLARRDVEAAWRKKDHVEMEVSILVEEIESLKAQRQREKAAQSEVTRRLAESKKVLEDERRMQIWLKEQAALLEKEVSMQVQVHEEDMEVLRSSIALSKPLQTVPQNTQTFSLQGLAEDYNQRAVQAWQEAAAMYQTQTEKLEESLNQTMAHMAQLKQEKRESQLQVQNLAKELDSTRSKRELLERNLTQQKNRQNEELQHLQALVEALKAEKVDIGEQIGELMVDKRNLQQMKMSLGLEVATYRALLDSENLRIKNHSTSRKNTMTAPILEALSNSPRTYPGSQTISFSHHFRTPPRATSRFITHSEAKLMTLSSSLTVTPSAPPETPKRNGTSEEENVIINKKAMIQEESAILPSPCTGTGSEDHFNLDNIYEDEVALDAITTDPESIINAQAVQEKQGIITESCNEAVQIMLDSNKAALISLQTRQSKTSETVVPPNVPTENVNVSEDGEKEETEISAEMSQISHAPMFAWEEDDTVVLEERDAVSELGLDSENMMENETKEFRMDTALKNTAEDNLIRENTDEVGSEASALSGYELGGKKLASPLSSEVAFSHSEKEHDILTLGNVQDNVGNFPEEEESLEIAAEAAREATEMWEEKEKSKDSEESIEMLDSDTEAQEGHVSDSESQKDEQETESEIEERNLEERNEEENTDGDAKEDVIVSCETFGNTAVEFTPQTVNTASGVEACMNLEHVEQTEELVMEADDKEQFYGEDQEEEEKSNDDESLNISASWRTDPGEADSYAQENTLADTRPLIHYKSDEETDGNTQATRAGLIEISDSEEERERHEGLHFLSQNTSKRFDTMEDLSEEPEMGNGDDTVMDGSSQTMVEGYKIIRLNVDDTESEEPVQAVSEGLQCESGNVDSCNLADNAESDFSNKNEEGSKEAEEAMEENQNIPLAEKEKENENELLPAWSESEDREINETQTFWTEQSESSEVDNAIRNDYMENPDVESNRHSELKGKEVKAYFEDLHLITQTSVPETSQNQELEVEPSEQLPNETAHCDMFPFETAFAKEQVSPKEEEDEQSNLSMLTHADLIDNLSIHSGQNSRPDSQINTVNSDMEESNSSEDESPNASQCSKPPYVKGPIEQQVWDSTATPENDTVAFPSLQKTFEEHSYEPYDTPQTEESEISVSQNEGKQDALESSSMTENSHLPQAQDRITDAPQGIFSNLEDLGEMTMEKEKALQMIDVFPGSNVNDKYQSKEKENDPHNFFSSSIKQDFWSTTKFEMAATYDPDVKTETEIDSNDTTYPNQSTAFSEDWEGLGNLPPTNGKSEKVMDNSAAQSDEEEEEREEGYNLQEQRIPEVKQIQRREVKDGEVKVVQSDDSNDDGDSWSSGEE